MSATVEQLLRIEAAKVATLRYGRAIDAKDVGALRTQVFTPDVVLHIPSGDVRGVDAVEAFYAAALDGDVMGARRHFLTNQIADCAGDGSVEVESYFLFVSEDDRSAIGWGVYRDVVVTVDGQQRIGEKTIHVDVQTTLDDGWVRRPPGTPP